MADEHKRPGWYVDPDGPPGERWWNGVGWSESRRGSASSTPPPVYSAENPAPQLPGTLASSVPKVDARANRNAAIGFILGLVSVFLFNLLAPFAIVFSILGILRARQLRAQGAPGSTLILAVLGLVAGLIAAIIGIVGVVAFFYAFTFDVNE